MKESGNLVKKEKCETERAGREIYTKQKINLDGDPLFGDLVDVVSFQKPKNGAKRQKNSRLASISRGARLFLSVNSDAESTLFNFLNKRAWELGEIRALDVADSRGVNLKGSGRAINLTRGRLRLAETRASQRLRQNRVKYDIKNFSFFK